MIFKKKLLGVGILVAIGATSAAWATTGYSPHGIGMKAKGMGGVGIALPQDAIAGGSNPAGMVWVGNRVDFGVDLFRPIRDAEIDNMGGPGITGKYDGSETKLFPIPEFGYNRMVSDTMSLGVSVFGNGGMNTDYDSAIPLFGTTEAGIDLIQLFVVPTLSMKLNENHSIGIGINLAAQAFEANGLENFDDPMMTSSPGNVANNGHDFSYGAGVRLGWTGKVAPGVTLGATYQTRTWMTEFDDYEGLFAENGDFDVPSNWGLGIAVEATPKLTVAFDYQRINYSEVDSVGNSINNFLTCAAPDCILGADNGPGFGWEDQNVYKLGLAYQAKDNLVLRAGYTYGTQVIPSGEMILNVLAPSTVQKHLTLGGTYTLQNDSELTFAYMHAFEEEVTGPTKFVPGNTSIKMYQDSIGVAYGWKF
jgi:long-chain fatty acid transport protein